MRSVLLNEMAKGHKNKDISKVDNPKGNVSLIKSLISDKEWFPLGINQEGHCRFARLNNTSTLLSLGDGGSGHRDTAKDVLGLLTDAYPDNKYIYIDPKGNGWDKIARKTGGDVYEGPKAFKKIASVLGELLDRWEFFKEKGVKSILEYRRKYGVDLPRIFLTIDGLDSLLKDLSLIEKNFYINVFKLAIRHNQVLGFHLIVVASDKSEFDFLAKEVGTMIFYHKNKYPDINRLDFHRQLRGLGRGGYLVNIDKKMSFWFMPMR